MAGVSAHPVDCGPVGFGYADASNLLMFYKLSLPLFFVCRQELVWPLPVGVKAAEPPSILQLSSEMLDRCLNLEAREDADLAPVGYEYW